MELLKIILSFFGLVKRFDVDKNEGKILKNLLTSFIGKIFQLRK